MDGPYGSIGRGAFGEVFKGLAVPPAGAASAPIAIRGIDDDIHTYSYSHM
jgi:hypothetical protein